MTEALAKLLQLTPRVLFAIWVFGAIILFLPDAAANTLAVNAFREAQRTWIGPTTLGAFVLWLSYAAVQIPKWISKRFKSRAYQRKVLASIPSLNRDEVVVLGFFIFRQAPTQYLYANLPPATSLLHKGLLTTKSGTGVRDAWPYTIPDFVWKHLQEHSLPALEGLADDDLRLMYANFDGYQRRFMVGF